MDYTAQALNVVWELASKMRIDASAIRNAKTGAVQWSKQPLTQERLLVHLADGPARGLCAIRAGESTTRVALLDLDSHKGETPWSEMVAVAQRLIEALAARGLVAHPWRSRGGRGIHLIMVWDEPQAAHAVRTLLTEVLRECGLKPGTHGVGAGEVEVFPKQNRVPPEGFGSMFILPGAGASEPLLPELDLEGFGGERHAGLVGYRWETSAPVPAAEGSGAGPEEAQAGPGAADETEEGVEPGLDAEIATRALLAVPNGAEDGIDRDAWFSLLCAAREAGVDQEVVREWSKAHPSYEHGGDEAFDRTWNSIEVGKPEGARPEVLFRAAERQGFRDHVAADFEDLGPPPGSGAGDGPGQNASGGGSTSSRPNYTRDRLGRIEQTSTNMLLALRQPSECGCRLAFDAFTDTTLFTEGPGVLGHCLRPMQDEDYFTLRVNLEQLGFKGAVGPEMVKAAARAVARENTFDSARQWIGSLVWDGVPRIDEFMVRYLRTEDSAYARGVGRYLWTALAGRALVPGCRVGMSPVLVGAQGVGKTRAVEAIAPWPEAFAELDLSHRDADLARSVRGKLVVELGELRGLRTKEAEAIKGWMSRNTDEWTPKYMEFATRLPRRFVTIGTTNEDDFLADATGERRWLPVHVGKADVEAIERDRAQLWAEGAAVFAQHGVAWQGAEELAPAQHERFKSADPWEADVLSWLLAPVADPDGKIPAGIRRGEQPVRLAALLGQCLSMAAHIQHAGHTRRLAAVLRRLGFEKRRESSGAVKSLWHAVPGGRFDQAVKAGEAGEAGDF